MLGVRAPAPSAGRSPWRGSRRPAHGGEGRQSEFAPPASGWEREEDINRCSEPGLEIGGARAAKCVFGQRRWWPGSSWTSDSSEPSLPADLIIFQGRLSHPALRLGAPSPSGPLPSHRHLSGADAVPGTQQRVRADGHHLPPALGSVWSSGRDGHGFSPRHSGSSRQTLRRQGPEPVRGPGTVGGGGPSPLSGAGSLRK